MGKGKEKTCASCAWSRRNEMNDLMCVSDRSDNCADWVSEGCTCKWWEKKIQKGQMVRTIYLIVSGTYSAYTVHGYFMDPDEAELYVSVHNAENEYEYYKYGVECCEEMNAPQTKEKVVRRVAYEKHYRECIPNGAPPIIEDGCSPHFGTKRPFCKVDKRWFSPQFAKVPLGKDIGRVRYEFDCDCKFHDKEKPLKIAQDFFAMFEALCEEYQSVDMAVECLRSKGIEVEVEK